MNEELENKLSKKNIKPTAMRILVLQYFTEISNSISLKNLEAHFFKADTSTLFRTLKTFEENGLLHSINDGTGMQKYALNLEETTIEKKHQHYHFHCNKCRETFCLNSQILPKVDLPQKFKMSEINLIIKGLCANCNFV